MLKLSSKQKLIYDDQTVFKAFSHLLQKLKHCNL